MIKKIKLKAFKSYSDLEVEFKPLTLLSGLNNSGKSSLIQALRMFHSSANEMSPLLPNHGEVSDMRSRLCSPKDNIVIECHFAAGSNALELSEEIVTTPDFCPVCFYVGADRLGPQTALPLRRKFSELPDMGEQSRYVLDVLEQLQDTLIPEELMHANSQSRLLKHVLIDWLGEISPGVDFSFESDFRADISRAEIDSFRPVNVGFGLSYTLPVLVALLGMAATTPAGGWVNNWGDKWDAARQLFGKIVIIENPEAHLHPQGQTQMGRFISVVASLGVQVLVETHSDHLMDGIRLAVKDQLINTDDVVFHYLEKSKDGETSIESPKISSTGKLDFWPNGFFDQTLKNRALLAKRGSSGP